MSNPDASLKFGILLEPFHPTNENPDCALEQGLELITFLDSLGYDYAWVGDHHSDGFGNDGFGNAGFGNAGFGNNSTGNIESPDVFITKAAERTRNIRLGACVSSLSSQHPLVQADRIMQLDHMTGGRVALCAGPVALPTDTDTMGVRPEEQTQAMQCAIEVLVPLLKGEQVSNKTRWFELDEARLQLSPYSKPMVEDEARLQLSPYSKPMVVDEAHLQQPPYSKPMVEMAVAAQTSPAGASVAGSYGLGLITIGATSPGGFNALAPSWEIYERKALENNHPVDRKRWSLAGPVHIAETREQAFDNVRYGLGEWVRYFQEVVSLPLVSGDCDDHARELVNSGLAVIGAPEDAITQICRLQEQSGGFGCFLQLAHHWADPAATCKSYELFMHYVKPEFEAIDKEKSGMDDQRSQQ